jgi:hypothetical protein
MSAVEIEIERGDERNESSGMDLRCGLVFDSDIFAGMPKWLFVTACESG